MPNPAGITILFLFFLILPEGGLDLVTFLTSLQLHDAT